FLCAQNAYGLEPFEIHDRPAVQEDIAKDAQDEKLKILPESLYGPLSLNNLYARPEGKIPYIEAGYYNGYQLKDDRVLGMTYEEAKALDYYPPVIAAPNALLVTNDGKELFARGIDVKTPIASLTKIASLLTAMRKDIPLDTEFVVSENAVKVTGNVMGYKAGERYTFREIAQAMLVHSGNDAAIVLAENISGSVEAYADEMNTMALELGCVDSQFKTPHGLDTPGHYSTIRDMLTMTRALMEYPFIRDTLKRPQITLSISGKDEVYDSTNRLMASYEGAQGVKTGFTLKAGFCLMSYVERDGLGLYSCVLGTDNREARIQESKDLLNWGFSLFPKTLVIQKDTVLVQHHYPYHPLLVLQSSSTQDLYSRSPYMGSDLRVTVDPIYVLDTNYIGKAGAKIELISRNGIKRVVYVPIESISTLGRREDIPQKRLR
ncbi:MAG: D-alanyl-D-alanine carboxypeptidase family protein, partial [Coriobacteriia bacterium]|nr:D-alanyl-D-alanine carboxypeptidase family protein [Coriobacteriia bacterium]